MASFLVSEQIVSRSDEYTDWHINEARGRSGHSALIDSAGRFISGRDQLVRQAAPAPDGSIALVATLDDIYLEHPGYYGQAFPTELLGGRPRYEWYPRLWNHLFVAPSARQVGFGATPAPELLGPHSGVLAPAWQASSSAWFHLDGTGIADDSEVYLAVSDRQQTTRLASLGAFSQQFRYSASLSVSPDGRWVIVQARPDYSPVLLVDAQTALVIPLFIPGGATGALTELVGSDRASAVWYPSGASTALLLFHPDDTGTRISVVDMSKPAVSSLGNIPNPSGRTLLLAEPDLDSTGSLVVGISSGIHVDASLPYGQTWELGPDQVVTVVDLDTGTIDVPLHRVLRDGAPAYRVHAHPRWINRQPSGGSVQIHPDLQARGKFLVPGPKFDDNERTSRQREHLCSAVHLLDSIWLEEVVDTLFSYGSTFAMSAAELDGPEQGMSAWIAALASGVRAGRAAESGRPDVAKTHAEEARASFAKARRLGESNATSPEGLEYFESLVAEPRSFEWSEASEGFLTDAPIDEVLGTYLRLASDAYNTLTFAPSDTELVDNRGRFRMRLVMFRSASGLNVFVFIPEADDEAVMDTVPFNTFMTLGVGAIGNTALRFRGQKFDAAAIEQLLQDWELVRPAEIDWSQVDQYRRKRRFGFIR